jgi:23S rRNA (adenine2503-C2)-methyltransferase
MSINLLGLTKLELQEFIVTLGGKAYNGTQIFKWIHRFLVDDFAKMTDLSKNLRGILQQTCVIKAPTVIDEQVAKDSTTKWLVEVSGGSVIETVFIPSPKRSTLCISSQAGCTMNCSFCQTARQGFSKNLSCLEIVGQLWLANKKLGSPITNVVMMGMGEPLFNFTEVKKAVEIMRDEVAYALPRKRVTVSTSGVVPEIYSLAKESDVTLAVSLHAPTDELRNILVPINKKYPIANLLEACRDFIRLSKSSKVTIEYVMLKDINDSIVHAKHLSKILNQLPCKINLIPFNWFVGANYQCSNMETIKNFSQVLIKAGLVVTIRRTRGQDIDAACGQLAGKVKDITNRALRYAKN